MLIVDDCWDEYEGGRIGRGCSLTEERREGEGEELGGDTVNFSQLGTMVQDGGLTRSGRVEGQCLEALERQA